MNMTSTKRSLVRRVMSIGPGAYKPWVNASIPLDELKYP